MGPAPLQLAHPSEYCSNATNGAILAAPQHIASFSYDENRNLLLSQEEKDASLRWHRQPALGLDLRFGYERCTWRSEDLDEGIDGLIHTLLHALEAPKTGAAMSDLVRNTAVISWRGMLTKLLTCVYEEREGWEMNAMLVEGTLYLEESKGPSNSEKQTDQQSLQSYFGYSFESYCTSEDPEAPPAPSADKAWGGDVNTNVQWGSVVRTKLGDLPLILGGEVDCVQAGAGVDQPLDTSSFLELKTNMVIEGERNTITFERYKLLKHYVQSVLLGVPSVIIGFRQSNGVLAGIQSFDTLDLPTLVASKPHGWHATSCFNSGHQILSYVLSQLAEHPHVKAFTELPQEHAAPVFRITFTAADHSIALRQLTPTEVAEMQARKTSKEERAGFLPLKWVQALYARRSRYQKPELNY